jgi:hypothetical protein
MDVPSSGLPSSAAHVTFGARVHAVMSLRMVVVVAASALIGACPDPCVFGGNACNNICRFSRDFEGLSGCFVVEGKCITPDEQSEITCGSVDDCIENECCDPNTNLCVNAWGYTGAQCDANTCGDCDNTPFGKRCVDDEDCTDDESCALLDTLFEASSGVCRPTCVLDEDCPFDQRCKDSNCSVEIGTPCLIENTSTSQQQCLGLDCINIDNDGDQVDGYCTGECNSPQPCPAGFVCNNLIRQCRQL